MAGSLFKNLGILGVIAAVITWFLGGFEGIANLFSSFFPDKEAKAENTGTAGQVPANMQPQVTGPTNEQIITAMREHCAKSNNPEARAFEQYFLNPESPKFQELNTKLSALSPEQRNNVMQNIPNVIVSLDAERVSEQTPVRPSPTQSQSPVPENVKADKPKERTWSEWGYQTFIGPKHNDVLGHTHNLIQWAGTVVSATQIGKPIAAGIELVGAGVGMMNAAWHGESIAAAGIEGGLRAGVSLIPFGDFFGAKQAATAAVAGVKGTGALLAREVASETVKVVTKETVETIAEKGTAEASKGIWSYVSKHLPSWLGGSTASATEAVAVATTAAAATESTEKAASWSLGGMTRSLFSKLGGNASDKAFHAAIDEAAGGTLQGLKSELSTFSVYGWGKLRTISGSNFDYLKKLATGLTGASADSDIFKQKMTEWATKLAGSISDSTAEEFLKKVGSNATLDQAKQAIAAHAVEQFAAHTGRIGLAKVALAESGINLGEAALSRQGTGELAQYLSPGQTPSRPAISSEQKPAAGKQHWAHTAL